MCRWTAGCSRVGGGKADCGTCRNAVSSAWAGGSALSSVGGIPLPRAEHRQGYVCVFTDLSLSFGHPCAVSVGDTPHIVGPLHASSTTANTPKHCPSSSRSNVTAPIRRPLGLVAAASSAFLHRAFILHPPTLIFNHRIFFVILSALF